MIDIKAVLLLVVIGSHGADLLGSVANRTSSRRESFSAQSDSYDPTISTSKAGGNLATSSKRKGKFFGLTTTAGSGNNLQLGLSFIGKKSNNVQPNLFLVPFLNIPFGASSTSSYYGSNYATTPSYGTSTSLLGVNSGSIIYAVIIGLAAIILIPLFIYSFTGVSTSPYGRSDDIQSILTNLASRVDDALQNQYDIDAPSCLQRALCSQITSSTKRMSEGTAGSFEKIIDGLASNSYLNALLSGTKVHEAISEARSGASCDTYFSKCPYSLNSINRSLADYAEKYVSQQENNEDFLDSFNDVPLE
ncbi:hypothetical protein DAPPUDRAFT_261922 [Daphnia pulex]|uniref:Uncharacterized protein n=1 Tax=Daphnia pulex TaxID=6669 RepID=E9HLY1_DAPPU|nr:hypothetical protein DAPPUDRAFT_261922 [Daphnia pulex]|eukprot:EFX67255.1 hypothetical protein DAPPUDRAFT_261922 [Daphnia pulex]